MRNGRHRHPVVVPKTVFQDLAGSTANSLKQFLLMREIAGFEWDDPGLDLDMDRPEDYQRAMVLAGVTSQ
jgi:CTP:molybdopterin cytidylyltransferase MocA